MSSFPDTTANNPIQHCFDISSNQLGMDKPVAGDIFSGEVFTFPPVKTDILEAITEFGERKFELSKMWQGYNIDIGGGLNSTSIGTGVSQAKVNPGFTRG